MHVCIVENKINKISIKMNNVILIISTALGTFQLDKPNCQSEIIQVYLRENYMQKKKVRQIDYRTPICFMEQQNSLLYNSCI